MAEPLWSVEKAAAAMGAELPRGASPITGVSIDSRTLQPGDLFFAIRGERQDGHDFVGQALERGAAGAVVDTSWTGDGPLFRAGDTLEALNALGRAARARTGAAVIGITGSAGKTGTKEMLRLMLAAQAPVHASEKSYNNLWGVPLSLARMPAASKFGVFEMGMNHAGEIAPLSRMVRPHIALITTVAPVHIGFFTSEAEIAEAKAEIFEGLEAGGHAILPRDNPHFDLLAARARAAGAEVTPFGKSEGCAARLLSSRQCGFGSENEAEILGERIAFRLGAPGEHLAINAVAALAAVKLAGADLAEAAAQLARFEAPGGRGQRNILAVPGGSILVIDESYNANPASVRAALQVLAAVEEPGVRRRIAVLGDMLELGEDSSRYHTELAQAIDLSRIDLVFCAGPQMAHLHESLPASHRGGHAASADELLDFVRAAIRPGDAIMVKGSLGSRMGRIVEALKSEFTKMPAGGSARSAA